MRVGRTYVYERSERDGKEKSLWVFGLLALICGGGGIYCSYKSIHKFRTYNDVKHSLGNLIIYPSTPGLGYGSTFDPSNTGRVVHVNIPQSDIQYQHTVYDPIFNVNIPGAVTLDRRVEYCQWQEHVFERTEKTENGNERVYRTYTYTKGWHSHPINSLFFDQPAAHHNPQRQPVAAGAVDITGVVSSKGFNIPATYINKLKTDTLTFYFRPDNLQGFLTSPAYINDKFFYTGNNGWFLSKYEPSTVEKAMKMAFQYAEGTLLDFQLGDLFSVCDAGDVRVALQGKVLQNGVSAIALQNADGTLSTFKTLNGKNLILLQEGQVTADDMMARELGDRFSTLMWYIVGALATIALCALFSYLTVKTHKELNEKTEKNN